MPFGAELIGGFVFSSIGLIAFAYGKRMQVWRIMLLGIVLMAYPYFVPSTAMLEDVTPEYEELDGWTESTSDAADFEALPGPAQRYLRRIEDLVGAPVSMVSVGQAREQTILYAGVPL